MLAPLGGSLAVMLSLVRCLATMLVLLLAEAGCADREPRFIILATTTSVDNSGLLDALLPAFRRAFGVQVRVLRAGSGRALDMLRRAEVDVVISHARAAEAGTLRALPHLSYRKIFYNDFVIVGPQADPARVRDGRDAPTAMRRIAASEAHWVSRGDESGTHERERALWREAASAPPPDRVVFTGQGMANTLRVASEIGAYTLSDRATFLQLAGRLDLHVVVEGDPTLLNTYAIIVDPRAKGATALDGRAFADWLADGGGRDLVEEFRIGGEPAFRLWPRDRPRDRPDAVP